MKHDLDYMLEGSLKGFAFSLPSQQIALRIENLLLGRTVRRTCSTSELHWFFSKATQNLGAVLSMRASRVIQLLRISGKKLIDERLLEAIRNI
jgi:hypothetical protein